MNLFDDRVFVDMLGAGLFYHSKFRQFVASAHQHKEDSDKIRNLPSGRLMLAENRISSKPGAEKWEVNRENPEMAVAPEYR
jgi:hypothetical protein